MAKRALTLSIGITLALALSLFSSAAEAKLHYKSCKNGKCPPKAEEVFDEGDKTLIWSLSHNPALMNVEFLKFFIGRPENERSQANLATRHYYWYDDNRNLVYELIQTGFPGQVTESKFNAKLEGSGLTFDEIHKIYGTQSRRFYDYNAMPNELFSFAPNTFVSFSEPQNAFRVTQASIIYRGDPLPEPPMAEMQAAEAAMMARATAKGKNLDPTDPETIPMLMARVKTNPYDPEAHLHLAQAFQSQAQIHAAIGEYKVALAMSGDNPEVRDATLSALRSLHIIEDVNAETNRNLEVVDNGQRLRVIGNEKKSKKQQDATTY